MSLAGIIVAAGRGDRFVSSIPNRSVEFKTLAKQFWPIHGVPVLKIAATRLCAALSPSVLVIVARKEDFSGIEDLLSSLKPATEIRLAEGGARRQDSVRSGLLAIRGDDRISDVFVHDAARPVLSDDFLKKLAATAKDRGHVIPGISMTETLKRVDAEGVVLETLKRSEIYRVQTPQFFKFEELKSAHLQFSESEQEFTDDAALLEVLKKKVHIFDGDPRNIKITRFEDLALAEQWLKEIS